MIFHIARKTVLLCGRAIHDHYHFPADRVAQAVLDDRRTCPKCVEALLLSRTSPVNLDESTPIDVRPKGDLADV